MRMRIGELARLTGVTVETVRFYERRGVVPTAPRTPGGYREYPPGTVDRIAVARRLQHLGLSLDEIARTLRAHDAGATCDDQQWRLRAALDRVEARMRELEETRRAVADELAACVDGRCRLGQA